MIEFYIFGDMGSGNQSQSSVVDGLLKDNIHLKNTFICGLGDNIYENGCYSLNDNQFLTKFEHPYEKIPDSIKFYMCLGNHDYGYQNINNSIYQIQYGINSQKENKKWYMPHNYYQFHKKKDNISIDFFVMDTNIYLLSNDFIQKQFNDLKKWLKSSKADWKILYGHHTWRSVGGHGNADIKLDNYLTDLYINSPFDVYMCGHDHSKQVIELNIKNKKVSLIVCGTGGQKYDHSLNNFKNLNIYTDLLFSSSNLGFANCQASKKKLQFTFKNEKNQFEYIYNLSK